MKTVGGRMVHLHSKWKKHPPIPLDILAEGEYRRQVIPAAANIERETGEGSPRQTRHVERVSWRRPLWKKLRRLCVLSDDTSRGLVEGGEVRVVWHPHARERFLIAVEHGERGMHERPDCWRTRIGQRHPKFVVAIDNRRDRPDLRDVRSAPRGSNRRDERGYV